MVYSNLSSNVTYIGTQIQNLWNQLDTQVTWFDSKYNLIASGVKSDALYETCHPGTYLYDVDKANKPNDERGAIIAFGYNGSLVARIAITQSSLVYSAMYAPNITYGTWKQIS